MAESTGLEPVHQFLDDGLAIRCITTLPTLHRHNARIKGFLQKVKPFLIYLPFP